MKVMKFGGTSVGSAQRIKHVASLVVDAGETILVLSAMSGTTNALINITKSIQDHKTTDAEKQLDELLKKYNSTIAELYRTEKYCNEAQKRIGLLFNSLYSYLTMKITPKEEKEIVAFGERLSTTLMDLYLQETEANSVLLDATEFMKISENGEPDLEFITSESKKILDLNPGRKIYLTQGFICRNHLGEIDNLQRGGSDYTASLLGAALGAEEIQIWTDIDGMHNNDPRFVEGTSPVNELHFEEAAELAYFGAKILHPTCVQPAKMAGIPVRLLNTMQPEAPGTVIFNKQPDKRIKAVAAKDGITAIKIKSTHMLLAYGFLRKVFEIFEKYQTPIDMITTSEVGVSVTIDNEHNLQSILDELKEFGIVTVDKDMVIVCVVGDLEWQNLGFETKVLEALEDVPVRMISYGGSNYNISLLVKKEDKIRSLRLLSQHLF